jgi:hypothetical protein
MGNPTKCLKAGDLRLNILNSGIDLIELFEFE